MNKVILTAPDLDGYLSAGDKDSIERLDALYSRALECFSSYRESAAGKETEQLIAVYNEIGLTLADICKHEHQIKVYSFAFAQSKMHHAEVSRIIAKLRDVRTPQAEFVYYIQRAYELLFHFAYNTGEDAQKNYLIVKTPVREPQQNYAVHKISNIDGKLANTVMCVLLRGALLPSMIMSKEIQEFSSTGYVTPFALFKIKRDERKQEHNMEYILDLDTSYFNPDELDGKKLVFADPMNATGGSLVGVIKYLQGQGIRPASISVFNAISALKGSLRVIRAIENCHLYTLWMDPILNTDAYIMPGLGDAGDRINGSDPADHARNIIELLADYGSAIAVLYRAQLRQIEAAVLSSKEEP
ncbi:phosphoribosyltransferase [Spirochaetia bacterium]|nr:phosphoribosyltransferase [Spirochaetia bacterium]